MLFLLVIVIISDKMGGEVRMNANVPSCGCWVSPAGVLGAEVGYDGDRLLEQGGGTAEVGV